jgi:hypothetical protein
MRWQVMSSRVIHAKPFFLRRVAPNQVYKSTSWLHIGTIISLNRDHRRGGGRAIESQEGPFALGIRPLFRTEFPGVEAWNT